MRFQFSQLHSYTLGIVAAALTVIMPPNVLAFGTTSGKPAAGFVGGWYFYMEHSNITRAALSCASKDPVPNCFEAESINVLAGDGVAFGAVGAADNYSNLTSGSTEWHCAEADYIPPSINGVSTGIGSYPTSEAYAKGVFQRCRDFVKAEFTEGSQIGTQSNPPGRWGGVLGSARYYFTTNNSYSGPLSWAYAGGGLSGGIGYASLRGINGCVFNTTGSASGGKCYVLNSLGRGLHVVMDFYAHSNWGDLADPSRPISIDNPPGLGQTSLAPFWEDLDAPMPWTEGLSSGCYKNNEKRGLENTPAYSASGCVGRTPDLEWRTDKYVGYSKDVADFNPADGSSAQVKCNNTGDISGANWKGCQPRGSIKLPNNTLVQQNVTSLAILEVRRQWAWVQKKIHEVFGKDRGDIVICYMIKDEVKQCSPN